MKVDMHAKIESRKHAASIQYYTVCYFTGIFYAIVRNISVLFIDNKDSVFCICKIRGGGVKYLIIT